MNNNFDLRKYFDDLKSISGDDIMPLPTKIAENSADKTKRKLSNFRKTKIHNSDSILQEQEKGLSDIVATKTEKLTGASPPKTKNIFKDGNSPKIDLYFDKFLFPVTYDALKVFILDEMKLLSQETGYSLENLKIEFKDNTEDDTIAYFSHAGDQPIGFCFHLNKFHLASTNKIIDTCRHEFAHFVVCMQNAGEQPKNAHGTKWIGACNVLGAKPSAHMHGELTKHFNSAKTKNYKTKE